VSVTVRKTLAEALDGWIADQRLRVADVARSGGLSRQTVYNIRDGELVSPETVRKLARGVATDPRTGVLDRSLYGMALSELFLAAGFKPPEDEVVTVSLEDQITRLVGRRATAEQIARALELYPELSQDKRTLLMAAIRNAIGQ
jgi:hypothetical protein